jgi:two-component system, LuxR family, response regulator FixJ
MEARSPLILIDEDVRRRARISHLLSSSGIHVEPCESAEELGGRWSRAEFVLAHDQDGALAAIAQALADAGHWLPVIAFSETADPPRIVAAILAGAVDYVTWPFEPEDFRQTLERSRERAQAMGQNRVREAEARNRIARLTRREREVLAGVASGLSNRLIADKLCISPRTVEIHRANMLTKIGVNHSSEAIRIAIEASLVN